MKSLLKFLIVSIFISITLLAVLNVSLGQKPGSAPTTHNQPPTTFTAVGKTANLAINFYSNPKLVDHGYVLNKDDKVCVGDVLKVYSVDLGGEWFGKGGPNDSPPITWISSDQMNNIANNVNNWHKTHTLPPQTTTTSLPETILSNKDVLGMEITLYKTPLFTAPRREYPWAYGTLICTANSEITFNGQPYTGSEVPVSNEGQLKFDVTAEPTCLFYLEKVIITTHEKPELIENYYYTLSNSIESASLSTTINLLAVEDSNGPNFEISRFSLTPDNYVRLLITNNGGMTGKLDYIGSNVPLSVYNTPEIQPGQTWEVFGKLQTTGSIDEDSLTFNLVYRSNELGCLKIKEYGVSGEMTAEACQSDGDCKSGFICCQNYCRDPSKGVCKDVNGDGIPDWVPYVS